MVVYHMLKLHSLPVDLCTTSGHQESVVRHTSFELVKSLTAVASVTSVVLPNNRRQFRFFLGALIAWLLVQSAYPLYQWFTYGHLFYTNADDESSYLQYDFARASRAISRSSEYLVVWLHELGVASGVQNLLFDTVCTIGIALFTRAAFLYAGFNQHLAGRNALLLLICPLLLGGANSAIQNLYWWNLSSQNISWLAVPQAPYTPFVRTPEPQFSLLLLSIATYAALRWRRYWPMYAITPLLYAFVAIPVLYATLTFQGMQILRRKAWSPWLAAPASFILIGAFLGAYHALMVPAIQKEFLVSTHSPVLSFSAVIGSLIALLGFRACPRDRRALLCVAATAPLVALNQQIISGWVGTPHSHEQYMGVICSSLVCILGLNRRSISAAVMIVVVGMAAYSQWKTFEINRWVTERLDWTEELFAALRDDSARVAINDVNLAMNANMIFPRQPSTAFGYERSFATPMSARHVREYLAAREYIRRDPRVEVLYHDLLQILDKAYAFQGRDAAFVHLYLRPPPTPLYDLNVVPTDLPPTTLRIFSLRQSSPNGS